MKPPTDQEERGAYELLLLHRKPIYSMAGFKFRDFILIEDAVQAVIEASRANLCPVCGKAKEADAE